MRTLLPFAVGLVLLAGCGKPGYAPVAGKITLDGRPLANVAVSFQPIATGELNTGPGSSGRTNEKGEYTLTAIGGGTGAAVGKHRVEIHPVVEGSADNDRAPPPKVKVPAEYNAKSTLTFEVKPGHNTANFDLSSTPGKPR